MIKKIVKIVAFVMVCLFLLSSIKGISSEKIEKNDETISINTTENLEVYVGKIWIKGEADIFEDIMEIHVDYSLEDPYEINIPEKIDELNVTFIVDWEIKNDQFFYEEEWTFFFHGSNGLSELCWYEQFEIEDEWGSDDAEKGQFRVTKIFDCFACGETLGDISLKAWYSKSTWDFMENITFHSDSDGRHESGSINFTPDVVREIKITKPLTGHKYKNDVDCGKTSTGETIIQGPITIEAEMLYPYNCRVKKGGAVVFGCGYSGNGWTFLEKLKKPPFSFYWEDPTNSFVKKEDTIIVLAWEDYEYFSDHVKDTIDVEIKRSQTKEFKIKDFFSNFLFLSKLFSN